MSTDRQKLENLFADAVAITNPAERAAFIAGACGTDAALCQELESLLAAHDDSIAAPSRLIPEPPDVTTLESGSLEQPGTRIGHYKLLEKIGEGGFGDVWMAEQDEPVRRRVALKIIKLGMDTKEVVARFEAERQALALMEHPNIARVFDGGATENGRPYFVMELVRGIRITEFCDTNQLPTGERLGLFIQVCHAVQHAHQKGIIHRDLKPSNILVTLNDGVPVPKVIDFGIAKATQQRLTDKTLFTHFQQFLGTPAYTSPEQAELSSLDVDTRSDIYSLGVLLYELLTGATPFDSKTLLAAGLDEMRRIIREQEPPRPSTKLTTLKKETLATLAKLRRAEAPKLIHLIRGDLDWIVMKCLEKDRRRRYETANGLAMDLQRYLSQEPIVARPPSKIYRFQKLVCRNKLAVAAGAAVALSLIIGLGVSTWLFFKERKASQFAAAEQRKAQTKARESQQVTRFLKDMLNGVGPSVARGRDTALLKEILDKTADRIGKELQGQPEVEAELRDTLGGIYADLSEFDKAAVMYQRLLEVRRKLVGREHPDVADALAKLGDTLGQRGKATEGEILLREALTMQKKFLGDEALQVAKTHVSLGDTLLWQNRFAEGEAQMREAVAIYKKPPADETQEMADALGELASALWTQEQFQQAEGFQRQAIRITERLHGKECVAVAEFVNNLAAMLDGQGKTNEARELYERALSIRRKLLPPEHLGIAQSLASLGNNLSRQGHLAEAEPLLRQALQIHRKFPEHPRLVWSLNSLGNLLTKAEKLDEAEQLLREAVPTGRKVLGGWHQWAMISVDRLAEVLAKQGKRSEIEQLLTEALASVTENPEASAQFIASRGDPAVEALRPNARARLLSARGHYRARFGRWTEAAADYAKAVELQPQDDFLRFQLAPLLVQVHDLAGYEALRLDGLDLFAETNNPAVAQRMAKHCLILPWSGAGLDIAARWAETGLGAVGPDDQNWPAFLATKALAEYRQERLLSAADWAQKALSKSGENLQWDVQELMVLAMAQHRVGQAVEAKAAFAQGKQIAAGQLPGTSSSDFGDNWANWLIAQDLLREAKGLIEAQSVLPTEVAELKLKVGDPAPKLQTGRWIQGEPVKAFEKGKVYLIEFWAAWCPGCRLAVPHLNYLHTNYQARGLVVIGQNCWEDNESLVKPTVMKMGDKMTCRVALDDKQGSKRGKMAETWMEASGQFLIPTVFIVDQNGVVACIDHPIAITDELVESILTGAYDLKTAAAQFQQEHREGEEWRAAKQPVGTVYKAIENKAWDEAFAALADAEKLLSKRNSGSLRLRILLAKRDYAAVLALAEKLYRKPSGDGWPQIKAADALNEIAWKMAVDETLSPADLGFAETIALWADEVARNKDACTTLTLARIAFRQGNRAQAIALQEKAVKLAHGAAEFEQTLQSYKKGELPKPVL